jgi:type I restriction enzyme S subunit
MAKHPGVVTGRYGTIGEVFFLDEDFWPLNTALYVRDFKGNDQRYVYYTIRAIDFGIYSDKGAVPGINRNHLHAHIVLWAPLDVQRAFRDVLESSWTRQRVNRSESETLAATRDLLLPKLMSGELRVRDAEKLAEAVM